MVRIIVSMQALIFISVCLSASPAAAETAKGEQENPTVRSIGTPDLPESRAEIMKRKRRDKAEELEPSKTNVIEHYAKKIDRKGSRSVEDLNFWGFHPRLDSISRGSGVALGVRYWNPEVAGPLDIMGSAFYSLFHYQFYDLQVGMIPNRGKRIPPRNFESERLEDLGYIKRDIFTRFKLYASARYRDRTDESFFGRGADSKREDRSYYRIRDTLFDAVTGYQITRRISYTFKIGLLQHSLAKGRSSPATDAKFPPSLTAADIDLPGRRTPPNYVRYHLSVLFDFRDNPGVTHRGFMVAFSWEKYDNINTLNRYNFNRYELDARTYIPLGTRQRVLAFHFNGVNSDPAPDNRIPFFLQPSLGGDESLRGYDPFRFQGDKKILLQGEYRWEASRMIEFALFGDTGTVANQGEHLSISKMKSDAGGGFRFKSSRTTLFRFDVARSNEGFQYQLRFSAVF